MKLNDFTAVRKMLMVVFVVSRMLAVGKKPRLTGERWDAAGLQQAVPPLRPSPGSLRGAAAASSGAQNTSWKVPVQVIS